jgi:hypothetical protein
VLRYAERSVECRALASDLAWLEEFLSPWFACAPSTPGSTPDTRIDLVRDDARAAALQAHGVPEGARRVDAFAMDRGMEQRPLITRTTGEPIAIDESLGVFYRIANAATDFEIIAAADAPKARIALMRAVRELAMSELLASGALLVHGAVLAMGGRGALIVGPKRAGKTTLLIHGLRAGAALVSNDRVVVERGTSHPVARGMPTVLSVRQATLDVLPELNAQLAPGRYDHLYTLAEIDGGQAPLRPRPGRSRNLTAAQLCRVLGAKARREAPLDTLVLLRTLQEPGVQMRTLTPGEAIARLEDCRFGTSRRISALFPEPSGRTPGPILAYRDIVGSLHCLDFALGIGTDATVIADGLRSALA